MVGIKHLELILALQEYSAVSTFLAFACGRRRRSPFDVKLAVSERPACTDAACPGLHRHHTAADRPVRRTAVHAFPLIQVFAVKKNDGIGRRSTAGASGSDNRRHRAVYLCLLRFHPLIRGRFRRQVVSGSLSHYSRGKKKHHGKSKKGDLSHTLSFSLVSEGGEHKVKDNKKIIIP